MAAVRNPVLDARRTDPDWRDPLPKDRNTTRPYQEPAGARAVACAERTFPELRGKRHHP